MCTVTYLPSSATSFVLTHNRDEHHTRGIALLPEKKNFNGHEVIAPTDPNAGGTWFAASTCYTLCLLNGGFSPHKRILPYRQSRGFVIHDFFSYSSVNDFVNEYNVKNIEPFTLIIIEHLKLHVHQVTLEKEKLYHEEKDPGEPHIWSSTTLYPPEDRLRRKKYFERFAGEKTFDQASAIKFHTNKFEDYKDEGIQINRDEILKTVSLISVRKEKQVRVYYEDFIQQITSSIEL